MVKSIEFTAGYYEWLLYVNNKLIYVFNSGFEENFTTKKELKCYVDFLISDIVNDIKENKRIETATFFNEDNKQDKERFELWKTLTDNEIKDIKEIIIQQWERFYL